MHPSSPGKQPETPTQKFWDIARDPATMNPNQEFWNVASNTATRSPKQEFRNVAKNVPAIKLAENFIEKGNETFRTKNESKRMLVPIFHSMDMKSEARGNERLNSKKK